MTPAVSLHDAELAYGSRVLWSGLDLQVQAGEFVGVLGPNGAGKSSLLRVLLGEQPLRHGRALVCGEPVHRGSPLIGYIPQHGALAPDTAIRGRDLVGFGWDGHRIGISLGSRAKKDAVQRAMQTVGATAYADAPLSMLSGGERQRLRIAQALVTRPRLLLCDEPLLNLDLHHQREVAQAIDRVRRLEGTAVLFVTHEINPILPLVDHVAYLAGGKARVGTAEEVMRAEVLSELYGAPVDVLHHHGRIVVLGGDDSATPGHDHHHEEAHEHG
ncbi:ATP-binding cassette domain-containing protein [Allobranchiibius sp. GilTou38]|uniref:ATP-binding cassette domain-containing protein n=1 Tax=Allobranchiibius sp. GilTou38 TaxID=2815210 RepID=UPI001AA0D8BE|nr:ATP-binding cassette domain-containing protein [Allobranchiibius sp. GilTou38]